MNLKHGSTLWVFFINLHGDHCNGLLKSDNRLSNSKISGFWSIPPLGRDQG